MSAGSPTRVALFCADWGSPFDERAWAARSLAGALSRCADVDVYTPGPVGVAADGAFDVRRLGVPDDGNTRWPRPADVAEGAVDPADLVVGVATDGPFAVAMAGRLPSSPAVAWLGEVERPAGGTSARRLHLGMPEPGATDRDPLAVGLHVPVHPMAAERRHVGMGFTGYTLVLSDGVDGTQDGSDEGAQPVVSPLCRWVIARHPRRVVVVIQDALATIWRSRSLLGSVTVDSRMDLWRIMAHASVTVDLSPGPLLARECVESLRYGVPVVAPAGSAGGALARASAGGLWYSTVGELLECVGAMDDRALATELGRQGRAAADAWYGDVDGFVRRVASALEALGVPGGRGHPATTGDAA